MPNIGDSMKYKLTNEDINSSNNENLVAIRDAGMLVAVAPAQSLSGLLEDAERGSVLFNNKKFGGHSEQALAEFLNEEFGEVNAIEIGKWHNQGLMGLAQQIMQYNTVNTNGTYAKTGEYSANYISYNETVKFTCHATDIFIVDAKQMFYDDGEQTNIQGYIETNMELENDSGFKLTEVSTNNPLLLELMVNKETVLTPEKYAEGELYIAKHTAHKNIEQLDEVISGIPNNRLKKAAKNLSGTLKKHATIATRDVECDNISNITLQSRLMLTNPNYFDFNSYNTLTQSDAKNVGKSSTLSGIKTFFNQKNSLQQKMQALAETQKNSLDNSSQMQFQSPS